MRVVILFVLLVCFGCSHQPTPPTTPTTPTTPSEPEKVYTGVEVHAVAENALAAEKLYGGRTNLYRVEVLKVEKRAGGFVLVGVGAGTLGGDNVPGSEFKIGKRSEVAFADLKAGQGVTVRSRYTGVAPQPGAYKDYVVLFEDAEIVKK